MGRERGREKDVEPVCDFWQGQKGGKSLLSVRRMRDVMAESGDISKEKMRIFQRVGDIIDEH